MKTIVKDRLVLELKKFLQSRLLLEKPLLLGYSGGPDSKALLYLFLECRRFFPLNLHLAHVDHGWREESKQEAETIEAEAQTLGLPLHIQVLDYEKFKEGNLEEQGRNFRLQFFSELHRRLDCQALVLGHQAGDQAETVLKRVCEGASLFSMGGLTQESQLLGMTLWRPLLGISKGEILEWLSQKNLKYFQDPTNHSTRFLRGRMRKECLPALQESFGKQIESNFCQLGQESREIREYFFELNRHLLDHIEKEGCLDLNPFPQLPSLQLKYLLKEWMRREQVTMSRQILDAVVLTARKGKSGKRFQSKAGMFLIENGIISFYKS